MATITAVTWNVQGFHGFDVSGVADVLGRAAPDVVVLQEVQRRQARDLAVALGVNWRWAFKHWPLIGRPEGAAVLSPHRLDDVRRAVLRRSWWWSWRRRIALVATVVAPEGTAAVVNVHLSPHEAAAQREREMLTVIELASGAVIAGDLNLLPESDGLGQLLGAGWSDAWTVTHPDDPAGGATNWTVGPRAGRPPTQRIDFVLVPAGWRVEACDVLAAPESLDWFAERSDHLPLLARVVVP